MNQHEHEIMTKGSPEMYERGTGEYHETICEKAKVHPEMLRVWRDCVWIGYKPQQDCDCVLPLLPRSPDDN